MMDVPVGVIMVIVVEGALVVVTLDTTVPLTAATLLSVNNCTAC